VLADYGDLHGGLGEDVFALAAIGFLAAASKATNPAIIFDDQLDAALCGLFLILVTTILVDSGRQWIGIGARPAHPESTETPFVASQLQAEEI
jgi:hypothetical protein